ncbi:MAG: HU family DNA-binding protein [Candidatus Thiodiazotropha sp. (ex. Lucinisca nassula)]|uniref:Viral histone-like protein n=3 Tax=Candidatus Thiodiazotropha TaxID=1913444 RepID=A0A1E2UM75_9GAMM|nr:HU family DNA-binding protein [Candidatus Thiodiazotropha endoloripes]MBV2091894.1 HU family DNA-binding protein [Candidatus Thiodiazotropha taylori]MBW9258845.1 HU family DNA-binding protein [Candidatus Thiodiazotropha sp. (ex. Lucinisca nassula)]MCF1438877.1 HU family DNA-binding protein [Shewanella sp.]MCG7874155.1 HU family DNA-binding protein [Candidatus Thiodiazotropha lotti]MCG7897035.1 HU family DNA-binding protein [Candidatus Thiodiazotropha weberae]MCG7961528.1 HU family DNA-bind
MVAKKAAKKTAKKTAKKKVTAKKVAAAPRLKAITTKQTKTQILSTIAEETGLSRKDVAAVFSSLNTLVTRHLQKRGSGEFTIPDSGIKVRRVVKPRTKARMGRNPATGEAIKIAAKPAKTVVKLTALKALKDKI